MEDASFEFISNISIIIFDKQEDGYCMIKIEDLDFKLLCGVS